MILFCLWGHSIMSEISSVIHFGLQVKKKTKNKQPPPRQYFEIQGCIQIVI